MRISTTWIYTRGSDAISRKMSELSRTQEQISTNKRVLAPSDDPIAAASALTTEQARSLTEQYARNQGFAQGTLVLAEATLSQVGEALQDVRTLAGAAGYGALSAEDRRSLAIELRGKLDSLLGLANTRDGAGGYLFSGYQDGVQPFASSASGVAYQGDQGNRALQVGTNRQIAVSASGNDVFEGAHAGNGSFTVSAAVGNTGEAISDAGRVISPSGFTGDSYRIRFHVSAGVTTYDVINTTTSATLTSGAAYQPGASINVDGAQVTITGSPAGNDTFDIAPSTRQSAFKTIADLAAALESNADGSLSEAAFRTALTQGMAGIDQAHDHVLSVRTGFGARLRELDSLSALTQDQSLYYQRELSRLTDLDLAEAVSRLTLQQVTLQAAQQSYLKTVGLSLFNYL